MKIVLVSSITLYKSVIVFQQGLLSLATILKSNGFDVEIADFNYLVRSGEISRGKPGEMIRNMCSYLIEKQAEVIGFSTICSFYPNTILLAQLLKEKNPSVKILFGGPQASSCAKETLKAFPWIDIVAIGESELNILNIIDALAGKSNLADVPGIAYRNSGCIFQNPQPGLISNLDELPFPDYSLIRHIKSISGISIEVGRGCPFSCNFCSTKTFWKRKFRMKSVSRIIREMDFLFKEHGFNHFLFLHDHFTVNKLTITEFCNRLKSEEKMFTWECSSRADNLDKELIKLMKSAGCTRILIGIETGSPRMQKLIGKNLDLQSALDVIKEIVRNEIKVKLSFIYGFPEEDEHDLIQTLDLIRRSVVLGADDVSLYPFVLLNGVEYYDKYKTELVQSGPGNSFIDEFNLEENQELIKSNPGLFPNFFRFPSGLFDKYPCLDVFVSFYSFLQRYFPYTFKYLLEVFGLELGAFYLDFLKREPQFAGLVACYFNDSGNIEFRNILLLHISILDFYLKNTHKPDYITEVFDTEKTLLSLRTGIAVPD